MKARKNPFAIDRIEALLHFEPEWCGTNWQGLLDRWRKLDYRAAIVGPHGSGKSTLLRTLETQLSSDTTVHQWFLNDRKPELDPQEWQRLESTAEKNTVILLDGAEQLSRRSWQRFQKTIDESSAPLRALVTQHRASRFRWPTLLSTRPTPALLTHLIGKLAPDFRQTLTDSQIASLFTRHRGNLREALWQCYDLCSANDHPPADSLLNDQFQRSQSNADIVTPITTPAVRTQIQ